MDIKTFRAAREEFVQAREQRQYLESDRYNKLWATLQEAAAPEHSGKNIGEYMSDQVKCVCGWKSTGYWDGAPPYAWDEWREHVAKAMGLIPQKCPCGKTYLPVDGEIPCHELRPTRTKS